MIPYGKQHIGQEEVLAVVNALNSDYLTTGPLVDLFEKKIASYCGAKYAIAVSSGTAALHVAAMALGLGNGDKGITSPNTFLASANCMAYCNATPGFADVDPDTYCIDVQEIEKAITPETKLLIPVHFAGYPCDMESIWELAKKHNLHVIEDAAHALGSSYRKNNGDWVRVGACADSDLTIFSFHPVKTITSGEGGMILTNDEAIARNCRMLRNHGMEREPENFYGIPISSSQYEPWYYEMQALGYNYRITDIQCALGLVQMNQLDEFILKRRNIWQRYNEALKDIDNFIIPLEKEGVRSAWHLYAAKTSFRDALLKFLRENNIGAHAMYIPVHLQPWYRNHFGYKKGDYPVSENYFETCIILPIFPDLTMDEQEFIIEQIKKFFSGMCKS